MLDSLAGYVPGLILRRLAADPRTLSEPELDRFEAAILFADISGFTALTEQLAQRGPAGVEALTTALNTYFGQLMELIAAHTGDIVKLAGDALIAVWRPDHLDEDLAASTQRAARCALEVQSRLNDFPVGDGLRLSMRVGIGAGETATLFLGGMFGHWEVMLSGQPLRQTAVASLAKPGEVVLAGPAWQLVKEVANGTLLTGFAIMDGDGATRGDPVCLTDMAGDPAPVPAAPPRLTAEADAALRSFIPPTVRSRLDAGQTGWLAELRPITSLFVHLPDIDPGATDALRYMQRVIQQLEVLIHRYEGTLNKLSVDDKGTVLIAAFGLPPLAHEDDAIRGVQAAVAIHAELHEMKIRSSIGIATGRVFCGAVGGDRRREYTIIGGAVNLAARLMQSTAGEILCDNATQQAARSRLAFDELPPISVKGRTEPVVVYKPRGEAALAASQRPLVGRRAERTLLNEKLDDLIAGSGSVVVIEGVAGIGKTRLRDHLLDRARANGVVTAVGAGDAVKQTAYYAWQPVFRHLLEVEWLTDQAEQQRQVLDLLGDSPEMTRLAPLLNNLLGLDFPPTAAIGRLTGEERSEQRQQLLLHILQEAARRAPTLLVLDDAQWLDAHSWLLALLVAQRLPNLMLVIAMRPPGEPLPHGLNELLRLEDVARLRLDVLTSDNTLTLVRQRLGVTMLPDRIVELIQQKAHGNPLFSEELAYALRDAGLIEIAFGECRVAPGVDLDAVTLPDNVQGVITGRVDRLSPSHQLMLKAASVVGRVFAFRILRDIYPIEAERDKLADNLDDLEELDFTTLDTPDPELRYSFKHTITQEVVYNLMLFSQRRQLHRAVAVWFEENYAADLAPHYEALAYHWSRAEDTARTLEYLRKAGEQARLNGDHEKATEFQAQAERLEAETKERPAPEAETTPGTEPMARPGAAIEVSPELVEARRERQRGDEQMALGHLEQSRRHMETTLTRLGYPLPSSRNELYKAAWQQLRRRLRPAAAVELPQATPEATEAIVAYRRLTEIHLSLQHRLWALDACVRSLNLAESVHAPLQLGRTYALACVVASAIPWHRMAETYRSLACASADATDDPLAQARVAELTGYYSLSQAQFEPGQQALQRALEIARQVGDWRRWEESFLYLSALWSFPRGEYALTARQFREVRTVARRRGDAQAEVWGLCGQGMCVLRLGRLVEARTLFEEASTTVRTQCVEGVDTVWLAGLLALTQWRQGDEELAQRTADQALQVMEHTSPTAAYALEGYAAVAEVCLALWEDSLQRQAARSDERARDARLACASLGEFAKRFRVAQPRYEQCQGLAFWHAGRQQRARKLWQKSLEGADHLDLRYEMARAHFELGYRTDAADATRATHLSSAAELFGRLGAAYELELVSAVSGTSD